MNPAAKPICHLEHLEVIEPPHRAYELFIRIGGDSWQDVRRIMREFADRVAELDPDQCDVVTGGDSVGGNMFAKVNQEQTHDRYFEQLERYLEESKELRT